MYNAGTGVIPQGFTQDQINCEPIISCHSEIACSGGVLRFQKADEDGNPVEGATFTLETVCGQKIFAVSDKAGYVEFANLGDGNYNLSELLPPEGYIKDDNHYQIVVDEENRVTVDGRYTPCLVIKNSRQPSRGALIISKVDAVTKQPLAGCTYKLSQNTGEDITMVSNAYGQLIFSNLMPGVYNLIETGAPDNYTVDETNHFVVVGKNGETYLDGKPDMGQVFENRPVTVHSVVEVTTINSMTNDPLEGAVYTISNKNGEIVQTAVSGADGRVVIVNLPKGAYTLTELYPPAGYTVKESDLNHDLVVRSDGTVSIDGKSTNALTVKNTPKKVGLVFRKTDTEGAPMPNCVFELTNSSDEVIDTMTSNAEGWVRFETSPPPGDYSLTETEGSLNYAPLIATRAVTVFEDESIIIDGVTPIQDFVFRNAPTQPTMMTLNKLDEDRGMPMTNVTYNMTLFTKSGKEVYNFSSAASAFGKIIFPTVPYAGKLTGILKEIQAPGGYFDPVGNHTVEIVDEHTLLIDGVHDDNNTFTVYNRYSRGGGER